jgi:hypothetical protein
MRFASLQFAVFRHRLGNFQQCCQAQVLRSETDLLMYSTFAVGQGESARQQSLALASPHVLWWSIGERSHLQKSIGRHDPRPSQPIGRTRRYCSAARGGLAIDRAPRRPR